MLHVSAANGCYEIAKKILDWKSNCPIIDRKNKFGWTPLMQAIRNGDIDTVKLLLENNSNVNESTYLGKEIATIHDKPRSNSRSQSNHLVE